MRKLLYEITHTTAYTYSSRVLLSHHLLHLTPREGERQERVSHELITEPAAAVAASHEDAFGNVTGFLSIEIPHDRLVITSRSRVKVAPACIPDPDETPPWESARAWFNADPGALSLHAREFLHASPRVPVTAECAEYAAPSFAPGRPLLRAVSDLTRRIHEEFIYDSTATTVATPVEEVFRNRRGVCQDFAHFAIACLRALGLPARYVSGYVETDPPPGQPRLRGVDASHAWFSVPVPGTGWIDIDPTNNCMPSLRHVTLAWGRDYSDVAPVRGVLTGGGAQQLSVAVDVIALGPSS